MLSGDHLCTVYYKQYNVQKQKVTKPISCFYVYCAGALYIFQQTIIFLCVH